MDFLDCLGFFDFLDFWVFWSFRFFWFFGFFGFLDFLDFLDFGALPQPAQNPSPSGERLWGLAAQFSVQFGPLDLNCSIFGPLDLNCTLSMVLSSSGSNLAPWT